MTFLVYSVTSTFNTAAPHTSWVKGCFDLSKHVLIFNTIICHVPCVNFPSLIYLPTEDEPDAFMDHPLMNKKEKTTMYWVSYMDGLQRVLMFTQNPRVARQASQVRDFDQD